MTTTNNSMKLSLPGVIALCLALVACDNEQPTVAMNDDQQHLTVESALPATPYMGGPVELVEAPNGAIANKRILDGIEEVAWVEPTIEQPAEGIWVFGGYGLAPIAVIDTDEGLIAFDTGDTKHDGELLLEAIRTVSDKPIRAII